MAKKKYYAVRQGKVPGIYETWAECQKQTTGYSGAEFKSFPTLEDAEEYLEIDKGTIKSINETNTNTVIAEYISQIDENTLVAFVDGSYDKQSEVYGYGVVLVYSDGHTEEFNGSDNNKDYVESHNVAGEIEGAQIAITQAFAKGFKKVAIFYDYDGIEKWATGEWRAKANIAKDYVSFIEGMKYSIGIEYHKVKAHSGITYNEQADELAKKSLLKKGIKNNADGCVSVTGIDIAEFQLLIELLQEGNEHILLRENSSFKNRMIFILSFKRDRIVVTCFKNGTTLIQGKQSQLLEELMVLVVELMPSDNDVIELLNDYHEVRIEKSELDIRFDSLLPNFNSAKTKDKKLKNTLKQAVYNTMLTGDRPDYTDLATPGLRALEYYLYKMLMLKGIIKAKDGKHGFNCFDKDANEVYYLQLNFQGNYTQTELDYINKTYNFYNNHRHTLNHWNKDDTTRVLENMDEARALINDNLDLINYYYTIF